jgi:hypothetical protein
LKQQINLKTLKADELVIGTLPQDYPDEQTDVRALLLQRLNSEVLHQQFAPSSVTHYDVMYEQDDAI